MSDRDYKKLWQVTRNTKGEPCDGVDDCETCIDKDTCLCNRDYEFKTSGKGLVELEYYYKIKVKGKVFNNGYQMVFIGNSIEEYEKKQAREILEKKNNTNNEITIISEAIIVFVIIALLLAIFS